MTQPQRVDIHEVARVIKATKSANLMLVTGAGVSVASGLPTFRGTDPGAVWSNDVTERGTLAYFLAEPANSWLWYLGRFRGLEGALPNAAHTAIVGIEHWYGTRAGVFTLVTQNIDGLHRLAGSRRVMEVHGRADQVRCTHHGCVHAAPKGKLPVSAVDFSAFERAPSNETVPKCPECFHNLRPHVLWFDERYDSHLDYQIAEIYRAAKHAHCVLFVGTSFAVGVTEGILENALSRGARVFSMDPSGRTPRASVLVVAEPAEEALPKLVDLLHS